MKIGELSKRVNVSIDTIRYYEQREVLPLPHRTRSGYRDYSERDVKHVHFVIHAKALGFTLEEIRTLIFLKSRKVDCAQVRILAQAKASDISSRIKDLTRIQKELIEFAEKCKQEGNDQTCPLLRSLENHEV
ncbi:MAG: heavy metal-responsive transcriptional regulator [Mariprofundaceae bacterium]|nr:heavy metal-responsive transcriptional regulator [Mariprofundaceae bacterium]